MDKIYVLEVCTGEYEDECDYKVIYVGTDIDKAFHPDSKLLEGKSYVRQLYLEVWFNDMMIETYTKNIKGDWEKNFDKMETLKSEYEQKKAELDSITRDLNELEQEKQKLGITD